MHSMIQLFVSMYPLSLVPAFLVMLFLVIILKYTYVFFTEHDTTGLHRAMSMNYYMEKMLPRLEYSGFQQKNQKTLRVQKRKSRR